MAEGTDDDVRWLSDTEMLAWRTYIVSTLMLRHRLHRDLVEETGVSLIDYEVLTCLSSMDGGRMRMTELATMLGSTKSRLSHQIGRLEETGHVRRGRDPEDRRGVTAELTSMGRKVLENAAPAHLDGVRTHLIDLLTDDEQRTLGTAFTRVLEHLHELAD